MRCVLPIMLVAFAQSNAQTDFVPQRPEFERIAQALFDSDNQWLGDKQVIELERALAAGEVPAERLVQSHAVLAQELIRIGRNDDAVTHVEKAMKLASSYGQVAPDLLRLRAQVYLRVAEVENCINNHNADCCIFPLAGGGVHVQRGPALEAQRSLLAYLETNRTLAGAWLLNLVSMALGEYPDGVPAQYRIPLSRFESDYEVGRFRDIAPQLGLDDMSLCGGSVIEDFDNDGLLDIVASSYDPSHPLAYYRNAGDGTFEDLSAPSRLDDQLGGLNLISADYDSDGDADILVLRGAWMFDAGQIRNSLLRNNGDGTFTDVTRAAGLAEPPMPTQAAVFFDYDNDGELDLYVGNESRYWEDTGDFPSQLFRNNGDGTFTDVASQAGVSNDSYCKGVTAGDYDNDGDMDLYLSNVGPNRLYRNEGDGTFVDVAAELRVTQPAQRSFAPWFFDVNNDGALDIFVSAYDADIGDIAAEAIGVPFEASFPSLHVNDGMGGFTDRASSYNLRHPYLPMGANFGDIDHDGYLDMYLGTGDPGYESLMPNVMLRNNAGTTFQDVTVSGGFGHLQKGHGIAFGDLDNDGDQDIFHELGGFLLGDKFKNALFENPGHGSHYLYVKLVGVESNRSGVGARIKVVFDTPAGERTIHRAVGSVSSFGGSPLRQEIGLADATSITSLTVHWPASGVTQTFTDVPLDASIRITEDKETFERLPLEPFRFKTSS